MTLSKKKITKMNKTKVKNFRLSKQLKPDSNSNGYTYYVPSEIQIAYGLNLLTPPGGKLRGAGVKIAIIGCYYYAALQADLNFYCRKYGISTPTLNITNQAGRVTDSGWALEMCLDTQMVATVAPGATIYVIMCKSAYFNDIMTGIQTALNLGAKVVSMSFGGSEFLQQSRMESIFQKNNVIFCASSGDSSRVEYPSSSKNILSVGGTSLILNSNSTRKTETVWSGAGTGLSVYVSKPTYQANVNVTNFRSTPDICAVADPNTGVAVYCSIYGGNFIVGGTSASCPINAAILTVATQYRNNLSKPYLTSCPSYPNCIQTILYNSIYPSPNLYGTNLYDVTVGIDANYHAGTGFDVASGLGSVTPENLIPYLSTV